MEYVGTVNDGHRRQDWEFLPPFMLNTPEKTPQQYLGHLGMFNRRGGQYLYIYILYISRQMDNDWKKKLSFGNRNRNPKE